MVAEVVGIHRPEFDFEREVENIAGASASCVLLGKRSRADVPDRPPIPTVVFQEKSRNFYGGQTGRARVAFWRT